MAWSSLPDNCTPTNPFLAWVSARFNSCVPTPLAFLSTFLGICSIISWFCAQIPQIVKNRQLKSASGLSILFLAVWLLGDLTNLIGALLTGQASWQIVVATYYVTVDVVLCGQFFWYTYIRPWRKTKITRHDGDDNGQDGSPEDVLEGLPHSDESSVIDGTAERDRKATTKAMNIPTKRQSWQPPHVQNPFAAKEKPVSSSGRTTLRDARSPSPVASPKTFLLVCMLYAVLTNASPLETRATDHPPRVSTSESVGRVLSWISTASYLGSRLPQIYKNYNRRSTSGLSPTLFIAAFCGNLFYSSSMLTNPLVWSSYPPYGAHGWVGPEGNDQWEWITSAAPFFFGAAGVLVMDGTVGLQFWSYGDNLEESLVLVEDGQGNSKWRIVSGWMRGWIPGPDPGTKEVVVGGDDARPLLSRQGSRRDDYGSA